VDSPASAHSTGGPRQPLALQATLALFRPLTRFAASTATAFCRLNAIACLRFLYRTRCRAPYRRALPPAGCLCVFTTPSRARLFSLAKLRPSLPSSTLCNHCHRLPYLHLPAPACHNFPTPSRWACFGLHTYTLLPAPAFCCSAGLRAGFAPRDHRLHF